MSVRTSRSTPKAAGQDAQARRAAALDVIEQRMPQGDQKFDVYAMDGALIRAATDWLLLYDGDFKFLLSVRQSLARSRSGALTASQAKGICNTMLYEIRKRKESENATGLAALPPIEDGAYTITLPPDEEDEDDEPFVVRVRLGRPTFGNFGPETQVLEVRRGPRSYRGVGFVKGRKFSPWRSARINDAEAAAIGELMRSGLD